MFIKAVPNNRGKKGTYYCSLVQSYRENGKIKHKTFKTFGLMDANQVEMLRRQYGSRKSVLIKKQILVKM